MTIFISTDDIQPFKEEMKFSLFRNGFQGTNCLLKVTLLKAPNYGIPDNIC